LKTDRILGIDPGLVVTGVGLVTRAAGGRLEALYAGTLRPPRRGHVAERLHFLHREISQLIVRLRPHCLAVEEAFYHKNVRSALALGQARGVALAAAAGAGLEIMELSPRTVKQAAVGTGAADKSQVATMIAALLNMETPPESADACDALAVALAALHRLEIPRGLSA
jgi:crossover junction endodeoxyribonuclease RuvC